MFKLKADKIVLAEKDVTQQLLDFLRVRRWRVQRMQTARMALPLDSAVKRLQRAVAAVTSGQELGARELEELEAALTESQSYKGKRFIQIGEVGQTDHVCFRPIGRMPSGAGKPGITELFYLEIKRPGEKPNAAQVEWMRLREAEGFLVSWADSLDMFLPWYEPRFPDSNC